MDRASVTGEDGLTESHLDRARLNGVLFALSMVAVMLGGIIATGH